MTVCPETGASNRREFRRGRKEEIPMAHRAVLFDLDGTLVNTLKDIAFAMNRALRMNGLPEFEEAAYRYLVGDGVKNLALRACRERTDMAPKVLHDYQAYYGEHSRVHSAPYEGIPQMLRALEEKGMRLAVFSNKPHPDTCEVVRHYFPDVTFEVVRGQKPDTPVKPDPAGALAVAGEMGLAPEEFLYLGDTNTDMRCAVNAGMFPVGVAWGFRDAEELAQNGAKRVIFHPMDLLEEI